VPDNSYSELLSLAAHEFRTPVTVVSGYLRMLLLDAGAPLDERQRKMIEEADKSCGRLTAIVSQLSEIARLDEGALKLGRTEFDLFTMLDEVAGGVDEASDRNVRLELAGESAGARMTGDVFRLQQAFTAIFRAVLREQPSRTRVVVDRRRVKKASKTGSEKGSDASALVVVARAEDVEAARSGAPASFNEYRGGLGLALPIARRVVERHGGRMWSAQAGAVAGPIVVALPL
jgi:two-component system, NarL family, sensor histidine kinase BarA